MLKNTIGVDIFIVELTYIKNYLITIIQYHNNITPIDSLK